MGRIAFGTSGWRGIFCEDFTFENVRVVTQAIADHLRARGTSGNGVVIGYDGRFMGERFALETAKVLAGAGIKAFLCERDTPTPVIALEILRRKAAGGINFTASHNPYDYNGLKFSPESGGPALPETTNDIEKRANALLGEVCYKELTREQGERVGLIEMIDPRPGYFAALRQLIDFKAIAASGLTIAVNPLYGAGRGYLDAMLRECGVQVVTFNDHRDPYFGGHPPEPAEEHIGDFIALVKGRPDIGLGLATDGDADRYGVVDGDGRFFEPNYILALVYDYLLRRKGLSGDAARSVATSQLIDAVAAHHGQKVIETPVGFKFIGELITSGRILIGGEESAGMTIRGHVPDKDGILACLLVAEMVAVEKRSLSVLLEDLFARVGAIYSHRDNLRLSPELEAGYAGKLATPLKTLAGKEIVKTVKVDGCKYLFADGSWVLFRKSGTEPVVRVYSEAGSPAELATLRAAAAAYVSA